MQVIFTVFVWILMGGVAAHFARERGRNPRNWFFIGMLLGIFGLIALFLMPKVEKQQTMQRAAEPPAPAEKKPLPNNFWYYLDPENKQFGPMSFDALKSALTEGKVSHETYVWNEDLIEWKKLREFEIALHTSPLGK